MFQEIINYTNDIPQEVFSYNKKLANGLYIFVDLNEGGDLIAYNYSIYNKSIEMNPFFYKCLEIQENIKPVSPSKIFNPIKKIFNASCSGFTLVFTKKNLFKEGKFRRREISESLNEYFNSARKYIAGDFETIFFNSFQKFIFKYFNENSVPFTLRKIFVSAKNDFQINIYFRSLIFDNCSKAYLTKISSNETYQKYVDSKIFNKDDFNKEVENIIYGIADSLSTFNDKKVFLKHKTAPFEFNYRLTSQDAKLIWKFFENRSRLLPNPLPIFIDKKELNDNLIKILRLDSKIKYSEIIKKLFEDSKKDLGNYYLLFFQNGTLIDLDFVSSFQYDIIDMKIIEVFPLGGKVAKIVENIFEFEQEVANKIFNGQLLSNTKLGGLWLKYFGEIEYNPKYLTDNTYNQILRYRKAFYDFVYKSKRDAIQNFMFHDIILKGIFDDIRSDEFKDRNHTKEFSIKEKLNIWFSLFNYFDNQQTKNEVNMINLTNELRDKVQQVGAYETISISNDNEFAFAAGQLIRYILGQSETGERTHALLEPFLQKTDSNLFKLAIAKAFDTYKHAFSFYKGNTRYSFDRIMSQVMGINPDTKNMKELLPLILAGYFSESVFKKDNNFPLNNKDTQNEQPTI